MKVIRGPVELVHAAHEVLRRRHYAVLFVVVEFGLKKSKLPTRRLVKHRLPRPCVNVEIVNRVRHLRTVRQLRNIAKLPNRPSRLSIEHLKSEWLRISLNHTETFLRACLKKMRSRERAGENVSILAALQHRAFDLVELLPIFLFHILLVEDAKFLPIEPDTPETILAVLTVESVFKLLTTQNIHAELTSVALRRRRALIRARWVERADDEVIAFGSKKVKAMLVILGSVPTHEAILAVRTVRKIFSGAICNFLAEVLRPCSVAFHQLQKLPLPLLPLGTLAEINILHPNFVFVFRELFVEPNIFLIALVRRAEAILAIPTVEEKRTVGTIVALANVT